MRTYGATDRSGWEMPPVISYGDWILDTGEKVEIGTPLQLVLSGTTPLKNYEGKYRVKAYDDVSGEAQPIGVAYRRIDVFSEDGDSTPSIGRGTRRRDFGVLYEGILDMAYQVGNATTFGMRLAPHPSGCQEQTSGMALIGFALRPGTLAGSGMVKTRIFVYEEQLNS